MPAAAVEVHGLAALQRAFRKLDRDLGKGVREALEAAGEPVRQKASQLAHDEISGMARSRLPWWQMRVGVLTSAIYVAPVQRGVKARGGATRRRGWNSGPPSFPQLMLEKAMIPALIAGREDAVRQIEHELDDLFRAWELAA